MSNMLKLLQSKSEVLRAEGDKDWVKPTWTVGMAGRAEVLKLPVTGNSRGKL